MNVSCFASQCVINLGFDSDPLDFEASPLSVTVPNGEGLTIPINVTFAPDSAGTQNAILTATYSSSEYTQLALTGTAVPLPAAAWLFGSGLLGLIGISRRRKII